MPRKPKPKDGEFVRTPPLMPGEALQVVIDTLTEWWDRWANVHTRIKPGAGWTDEQKRSFLRENGLKAVAVEHAMREVKMNLKDGGAWWGNPMHPAVKGKVCIPTINPKMDPDSIKLAGDILDRAAIEMQKAGGRHHRALNELAHYLWQVAGAEATDKS